MRAIVRSSRIDGILVSPPSKSHTHRAMICALLSLETTRITNPLFCDDTEVTSHLSELMGADVTNGAALSMTGPEELIAPVSPMNCRGSGTSLRIFTALSALARGRSVLTGDSTLRKRPIKELISALNQLGVKSSSMSHDGTPPVEVHGGKINGGSVEIRGDVTSQYISGLLFACSKGTNETRIALTTHLESRPYVEMTLEVMQRFGVVAEVSEEWDCITIPGEQRYRLSEYDVEGDYSSAAFLMAAGALAGNVRVTGLSKDTNQGDAKIVDLLREMGANVTSTRHGYGISKSELESLEIDVSDIPDLVPILTVMATKASGVTRIINANRLRFKESDRLAAIAGELKKMGARISATSDGLTIYGPTKLNGAYLDSHGDHRIGMACVIAGLTANSPTVIEGVECISKSYPSFIKHIQSVGGCIELVHDSEKR